MAAEAILYWGHAVDLGGSSDHSQLSRAREHRGSLR